MGPPKSVSQADVESCPRKTSQVQRQGTGRKRLQQGRWIRSIQKVSDPTNILMPRVGSMHNQVFMITVPGQMVTCIAPPIWVWADQTRMASAWCIFATTYTEEMDINHDSNDMVAVGVVLVSTLAYNTSL